MRRPNHFLQVVRSLSVTIAAAFGCSALRAVAASALIAVKDQLQPIQHESFLQEHQRQFQLAFRS